MDEKKRVRAERFGITTAEMVAEKQAAILVDRVSTYVETSGTNVIAKGPGVDNMKMHI